MPPASPALAPICRSSTGSITPIIGWLQYADCAVAPIRRSVTPGIRRPTLRPRPRLERLRLRNLRNEVERQARRGRRVRPMFQDEGTSGCSGRRAAAERILRLKTRRKDRVRVSRGRKELAERSRVTAHPGLNVGLIRFPFVRHLRILKPADISRITAHTVRCGNSLCRRIARVVGDREWLDAEYANRSERFNEIQSSS